MKFINSVLFILLVVILTNKKVYSQEIVQFEKLEESLKEYCKKAWEAEREEFNITTKGKGWAHVPSMGIQFGLPSISWNTKEIYTIKKETREREAKLRAIDKKWELEYNTQLNNLRLGYEKWQIQKKQLERERVRLAVDSTIFQIHQEAYDKKEMTPLEYFEKLKVFETANASLEVRREELEISRIYIFQSAHFFF